MKTINTMIKNLAILIFVLTEMGCSPDSEFKLLEGDLIGQARVNDYYSGEIGINSDITITLTNGHSSIQTLTDDEGYYRFEDLVTGTYNLTFNKEGYYEHKILGVQFLGGAVPYYNGKAGLLYKKIDYSIDSVNTYFDSRFNFSPSHTIYLSGNVSDYLENQICYFKIFVGKEKDVSAENYKSIMNVNSYANELNMPIRIDTIQYPKGTNVYLIAYPAYREDQYYQDIETGKPIYTNIDYDHPSVVSTVFLGETEE